MREAQRVPGVKELDITAHLSMYWRPEQQMFLVPIEEAEGGLTDESREGFERVSLDYAYERYKWKPQLSRSLKKDSQLVKTYNRRLASYLISLGWKPQDSGFGSY